MTFTLAPADEVLQLLGQRLRTQRLAQGLRQTELAQMAGLSLGAVRALETSGKTTLETLVRAVQALGLAHELDNLFEPRRLSIAQMEQAAAVRQRKRAPRQGAA